MVAGLLVQYGRRKGQRSAGLLFVYWLLHTLAAIFILRERSIDIMEQVWGIISTITKTYNPMCCVMCKDL